MNVIKTDIPDLLIIEPKVFVDNRGYFFESYNYKTFISKNININFIQDNQSKSQFGVIRGLHYQLEPFAQIKLIRVLEGEIFDVAVDIRKNSPAYGKWQGIRLSAENKKQLLIPKGFAHGYSVLTESAAVFYKCDNYYKPEFEKGIIFNDPALNIDWKIELKKIIVSDKDKKLPDFQNAEKNFVYKKS
jgi:dTDP-4-dehydrorhamnose 3,5-epimerase